MRKFYYLLALLVTFMANLTAFAEEPTYMYIKLINPDHIKEVKYNKKAVTVASEIAVETSWFQTIPLVITPKAGYQIDSWILDASNQDVQPGKLNKGSLQISVPSSYTNGVLTVYTSKIGEEKIYHRVTFDMNDEAAEAINSVRANGNLVNTWDWQSTDGFDVEDNARLDISINTTDFHVDLFQVNGADSGYGLKVTEDMNVKINVHRYGNLNISVIGDQDLFKLFYGVYNPYTGTFQHNNQATIDGFLCQVDEKNPYLYLERKPGYKITSVKDENGEDIPVAEIFKVHDNMTLNILGEELVYDQDLVVFLYNAEKADGPQILTEDGKIFNLEEGYQTLKFAAEDNIVSLLIPNADGKTGLNSAYLNDTVLKGNDWLHAFNYNTVKHNDVILAFVEAEPEQHEVNVGGIGTAPFAVLRHDVLNTEDPSSFAMYEGTKFSIVPTGDEQIKVKFGNAAEEAAVLTRAGEEELTADENGAFHFTVNGPMSLVVEDLVPTAVNDIAVEGTAPAAIFNLQGIRVNADASALPAGIYVIDGKKVQVRK